MKEMRKDGSRLCQGEGRYRKDRKRRPGTCPGSLASGKVYFREVMGMYVLDQLVENEGKEKEMQLKS